MGAKLTTAEFIQRAKLKHGDKFDYSRVAYVGSQSKVEIVCPDHGSFMQMPYIHINRSAGCPSCAINRVTKSKTMSASQFIARSDDIHAFAYDYSEVDYRTVMDKVKILCYNHGFFHQMPMMHLRGQGCPSCGSDKSSASLMLSVSTFIEKANMVHNGFYNYSNVVYRGSNTPIIIGCPIHGEFSQLPKTHIYGNQSGCPSCGCILRSEHSRLSQSQFITRSNAAHHCRYDYSKSIYNGSNAKIMITCSVHGDFEQLASAHMRGAGCSMCTSGRSQYSENPTNLYYLRIDTDSKSAYKIGITTQASIAKRYAGADSSKITILAESWYDTGRDAFETEQQILKDFYRYKYTGPPLLQSGGNTELFSVDIFGLDR